MGAEVCNLSRTGPFFLCQFQALCRDFVPALFESKHFAGLCLNPKRQQLNSQISNFRAQALLTVCMKGIRDDLRGRDPGLPTYDSGCQQQQCSV
jgi:hypothetical protein